MSAASKLATLQVSVRAELTGDEELLTGTLLLERGSLSMDRESLVSADGAALIDRLTNHIDDSAESLGADGHLNGVASVNDWLATHETFGGVESDGSHVVTTQMLGDLEDEAVLGALNLKSVENGRKFTLELHIDDGTNNLGNLSSGAAEESYITLQCTVS